MTRDPDPPPSRRTYRPPSLRTYGRLVDFTMVSGGMMGMNDAAPGVNKTGF